MTLANNYSVFGIIFYKYKFVIQLRKNSFD